jgi:hypothetical protein
MYLSALTWPDKVWAEVINSSKSDHFIENLNMI